MANLIPMHVDEQRTGPADVDAPLTVPEVAEAIGRGERQVWNLLAAGAFGDPVHREITDGLGRRHLQRVVPPEAVGAYMAERNTQGQGSGAGTGSGSGTSSGSGSTNSGGGAGTGPGRT